MGKVLRPLEEKVAYILSQTTVVVDSSVVFDFHSQNLWDNLQETFPNLVSTDITVGEWERNTPVSFEERMRVVEWGKNLSTTLDSTAQLNLQDLPTLKLSCGVTVYPSALLQNDTETHAREEDYSQIQLVLLFEDTGQNSSLLSSNYSQMNKLKDHIWDYKFALGLMVIAGDLSADDARIAEMIKKDRDYEPNFPHYLSGDFPIRIEEVYGSLKSSKEVKNVFGN